MIRVRLLERAALCVVVSVVLVVLAGAGSAYASSVWFGLTSGLRPTRLPAAGDGQVVVTAENLGDASANGSVEPVVLEDKLPEHLKVLKNGKGEPEVEGTAEEVDASSIGPVNCSSPGSAEAKCTFEHSLPPYREIEMRIDVEVEQGASSTEENTASVTGGGVASPRTIARHIEVGGANGFGVEDMELIPEEEGSRLSRQAGAHPFQLTSVLALDTSELASRAPEQLPAGLVKDLRFQSPPGLIGNPTPFPQCTDAQFNTIAEDGSDDCGPQTAIGVATVTLNSPLEGGGGFDTLTVPLFNLTPLAGEPARFGFDVQHFTTTLDFSVRTGSDYGLTTSVSNINQVAGILDSKVTFWGVPGDPVHNSERGWACLDQESTCAPLGEVEPPPLLSLPTSCTGPMRTTVQADSWAEPTPQHQLEAPLFDEYEMPGLDGCNHLQFNPEISVAPDVQDASSSTGLTVQVHVPQTAALNPEGLAESALKDTTVVLPEGVAVNPGGADGLEACSEGEMGYLPGESNPPEDLHFTATLPEPLEQGHNFCPDASKIATAEIETPLLPHTLKGAVYLAEQNANPFGALLAMYIVVQDPVSGTLVKLPGAVTLNQVTGQLVSTFNNTPPLPFENLRLHFFGESRAPLGTPALCNPYTTEATFAPWSGNAPSSVRSTFDITSGPNGAPCPNPPGDKALSSLPFAPSLAAGSVNTQGGAFSPFTMTMSREDGNQNLKSISLHMPPGLSGSLTGIPLCGEPLADEGLCPASSQIGETTVSVGLGGSPFTVKGGRVYLTGPYEGAPFGLSIVNPAKAGPFDVEDSPSHHPACDCLVVRAKLEIDPHTAQITVTSDEKGPYAIPPIIEGIPLQIKHVNVMIGRPGFTFNPTNCNQQTITGKLSSIEEGSATISLPFQATNCATLQFAPKFTATTSGKTSKADGTSLTLRATGPSGPQSGQANFRSATLSLPKQLPSRLTTLQKACTAQQFNANPAGCPAPSVIGHVRVLTPILPVPLEGPAYFVSHGGEAFPNLNMVLQGYGVTIDAVATTFISKTGITTGTLKEIPDAPFTSFELTLPAGPYSVFTGLGNLCTDKLKMPTEFVAQNGMVLHGTTPIEVMGCAKTKVLTRAQKLAAALKACRKKAKGSKRAACESLARKRYGPVKKAKKGAVRKKK